MRSARLQLWAAVFTVTWPALAAAEPRVVVEDFKGPNARKVRSVVVEILEDESIVLVPPKKAQRLARRTGAELDSESGRVRVANRLGVEAFIEGHLRTVKRKAEIDIRVYRGSDGMEAAAFQATTSRWGVTRELRKKLWATIGPALAEIQAAAERPAPPVSAPAVSAVEQPRSAPTRPEEPSRSWSRSAPDDELPPGIAPLRPVEQASDEEGSDEALAMETNAEIGGEPTSHPAAFDLAIGARIGTRSFGYNDSLPGLRAYSLLPSPSLSLHGHWYPAAHFSANAMAHIGLDVRADVLVGVSSENKDGQKFSTNSHRLGIGLRGRIPMNNLELGVLGGWGQHAFSLSNSGAIDPDIPNINYSFLRLGADARYQFNPSFAVQLQAAFLYGLSLGQISSAAWFPHAKGNGLEAEVSFQLGVTRMLSFELAAGMQRYFMSLNPMETDPGVVGPKRVAGGALDKYFSSRLGLIIRP